MQKKLFLVGLLTICLFSWDDNPLKTVNEAFAQGKKTPNREQKSPNANDLSKEIEDILSNEKQTPTTTQNVQERFSRLTQILSGMLRTGKPVKDILSREDSQRIESLIKSGGMDEAAQIVHGAIMKLDSSGLNSDIKPGAKDMESVKANPASPLIKINIKELINRNGFGNILKLMNPAIDSSIRRLYFSGSKSTFIGVLDLDKDELIETFDIGIPGGFLILDSKTGDIYLFDIGTNRFFKIDIRQKKASEVFSLPSYLSLPKKRVPKAYKNYTYIDSDYPFKAGYLQDENAAYGVIEIRDPSGNIIGKIKHGPDALYFDIDQKTGKLYATNTGDGSISVFDLNNQNKKIKDIDVGTSVDEITLNPETGGLYIRNRLGGSTIYYYDQDTKNITSISNENIAGPGGIGMWPTGMVYDEGKLYVLSHYGSRVDVIDTLTNKVVDKIHLDLSYKPRTDGISTMVMDKKRKILYAAFPELGEIAIADVNTRRSIKTIKIDGFDKDKLGPARIALAINEETNRLFVYLSDEQILNVYQGPEYFLNKKIPSMTIGKIERISNANSERGIIYMGNRVLDAKTMEIKGTFSRGNRVIAFDNSKNRVYLSEIRNMGPAKMVEKVYEFEDWTLKKEWTLSPILSIPSSFAFDFKNNRFYVGYFESAMVEAFDLTAGGIPAADLSGGTQNSLRGMQQPKGEGRGRCGDGICQPVEKENGVCPEDCK